MYNDRIVAYRKLQQLEKVLDGSPSQSDIITTVRLRERNLLAFSELQSFNDTGRFRYKHPLIKGKSEKAELERLLKTNSSEFLRLHKNVLENITRYERFLRDPERESRRKSDRDLLNKHRDRESIFRYILEENQHEKE